MAQLCMTPEKWHALCAYAAEHPTCKLILHQHQGRIVRVTVADGRDIVEVQAERERMLDKMALALTQ